MWTKIRFSCPSLVIKSGLNPGKVVRKFCPHLNFVHKMIQNCGQNDSKMWTKNQKWTKNVDKKFICQVKIVHKNTRIYLNFVHKKYTSAQLLSTKISRNRRNPHTKNSHHIVRWALFPRLPIVNSAKYC